MIDIQKYEDYFQAIVTNYSLLNGFYHVDMFEFDSFLSDLRSKKVPTPCLVLESYTERANSVNSYNIHDSISGAIIILDDFDVRKKTSENKTAFLKSVQAIIKQIQKRMTIDREDNCHIIQGLNIGSMSIAKTNLVAGAYMGYRMEFTINDPDETELDNNWL